MYTYKKRLNNNVVVALDEQGQEQILTGRGIGFQVEAGTPVDDQKIEKVFTLPQQTNAYRSCFKPYLWSMWKSQKKLYLMRKFTLIIH